MPQEQSRANGQNLGEINIFVIISDSVSLSAKQWIPVIGR